MMHNIEDIKTQLIMLGNAAHDLRNIFAQQKKQAIPEVLAVDQMSGQLEGVVRRYAARIKNPIGPIKYAKGKEQLSNMLRQTNFFLRCLKVNPQHVGYEILPPNLMQQVIENIELQQKIIGFIDFYIEQTYKQKIGGYVRQQPPSEDFKKTQIYVNSLDFSKQINIQQCYVNPCITNLIDAARQTCNKAHNIQNTICFYIPESPIKEEAKKINKKAGKLEDSFRSILNSFGQEKDNIAHIKEVIKEEIINCQKQCQKIIQYSKKLQGLNEKDMKIIQDLCDQILLSVFFFNDVHQLQNISVN